MTYCNDDNITDISGGGGSRPRQLLKLVQPLVLFRSRFGFHVPFSRHSLVAKPEVRNMYNVFIWFMREHTIL